MKSKEELNALKEEIKERLLNTRALSDEELDKVSGGGEIDQYGVYCGHCPNCKNWLVCVVDTDGLYTDICCGTCGFFDSRLLTKDQVHALYPS